jgi:hypothetical protein
VLLRGQPVGQVVIRGREQSLVCLPSVRSAA